LVGTITYVGGKEPRIRVKAPYNPVMVNGVKQLPYRRWLPDEKVWELPKEAVVNVLSWYTAEDWDICGPDDFHQYVKSIVAPVKKPNVVGTFSVVDFEEEDTIDFSLVKTPLFPHQKEAVRFGLRHPRWLLGDKMGMGKSLSAITYVLELQRRSLVKHALIVCGVNSLKYNWLREISLHTDQRGRLLGSREKRDGTYRDLGNSERVEDINACPDELFWIINIEALRSREVLRALSARIRSGDLDMIIVDEVHRCANPLASQTKGLIGLDTPYKLAMTGTPLVNHPLDFYTPMHWLGIEKGSWWSFKARYGVLGGFQNKQIVAYRRVDELELRIRPFLLRRKREEVLNLPPKIRSYEYVEMTEAQKMLYREVRADIEAHLDEIELSPNPLSKLIRLRQVTGTPSLLSQSVTESAKLDRLKELVDEIVDGGDNVIVYSNWAEAIKIIQKQLGQHNPEMIIGEVAAYERDQIINRFQNDKACKVILGTVRALGTGVNLTAASHVIFFDSPWTESDREQAEDRANRIGQTQMVNVRYLVTKYSIDERVEEIVAAKGAWSEALVDGKLQDPITRSQLLKKLLME